MANILEFDFLANTQGFSEAIKQSMGQVEKLEDKILRLGEAMGIGFGLFKLVEYIKDAANEYTKIAQEQGKIETLLKSSNRYSEEKVKFLKEQYEYYEKIGISADKISATERTIYERFPKANDAFVRQLLRESTNFAAFNGGTPEEAANHIERLSTQFALNGELPTRGTSLPPDVIAALNKYGESTTNMEKLIDHFNTVVDKYYEGQAKKMHDLDPLHEAKDAEVHLRHVMGDFGNSLEKLASPHLASLITSIDGFVNNHMSRLTTVITSIGHELITLSEFFITKKVISSLVESFRTIKDAFKIGGSALTKQEMIVHANAVYINGPMGGVPIGGEPITSGKRNWGAVAGKLTTPAMFAGMGLSMISDQMKLGAGATTVDVAGGALQGAGMGAMIGEAFTPVGAAIGAALGALLGGGLAYWRRTANATEKTASINETPEELAMKKALEEYKVSMGNATNKKDEALAGDKLMFEKLQPLSTAILQDRSKFSESDLMIMLKDLGVSKKEGLEISQDKDLIEILGKDMDSGKYKNLRAALKAERIAGNVTANSGTTGTNDKESKVKGMESKQIIFQFNKDFIELHNTYNNVTESAPDIVRIVTDAVLQGLHAAELMSNS